MPSDEDEEASGDALWDDEQAAKVRSSSHIFGPDWNAQCLHVFVMFVGPYLARDPSTYDQACHSGIPGSLKVCKCISIPHKAGRCKYSLLWGADTFWHMQQASPGGAQAPPEATLQTNSSLKLSRWLHTYGELLRCGTLSMAMPQSIQYCMLSSAVSALAAPVV